MLPRSCSPASGSSAALMLPYLLSPETTAAASGLRSSTLTCSRSSSVILIGLSSGLGIVPLVFLPGLTGTAVWPGLTGSLWRRVRGRKRMVPGRSSQQIRGIDFHGSMKGLAGLRVHGYHEHARQRRKDVPPDEEAYDDGHQVRKRRDDPLQPGGSVGT